MNDLDLLITCALRAGAVAMRFYKDDPRQWDKDGGSPVSEADIAVDELLRQCLLDARPGYGWLSEESHDRPAKHADDCLFVIDPIDGTRGFLRGDDRWCISVAVVQKGRPIAGVLFAPALGRLLGAAAGGGAHAWKAPLINGDNRTSLLETLEPQGALVVSTAQDLVGAKVEGPNSWLKRDSFSTIMRRDGRSIPSLAWRFALVATGEIDAAISKPRSHDWDLAACDLLVHEAGGGITDLAGLPPIYNQGNRQHSALVAGNDDLREALSLAAKSAMSEEAGRD